jgi:G3E family GTPase
VTGESPPSTPLLLIAGFLGAGKTTLLRTLLPRLRAGGVKPHVILNDYQNARVDAASLDLDPELVHPIAGSCICCGSQAELMGELQGAELAPESVMLLEANGTADTTELIEILTADRRASRYTPPVQVTVVDTVRWQRRRRSDWLERIQVRSARYLRLTRLDEVGSHRREKVMRSIRQLAPRGRPTDPARLAEVIVELRSAADSLPPRRFAGGVAATTGAPGTGPGAPASRHLRHHFSSMEIPLPEPVEEQRFRRVLQSLPNEVLRVKGIARIVGRRYPMYVQRTDRPDSVRLLPIRQEGDFDPVVILIGIRLDQGALTRTFASL